MYIFYEISAATLRENLRSYDFIFKLFMYSILKLVRKQKKLNITNENCNSYHFD